MKRLQGSSGLCIAGVLLRRNSPVSLDSQIPPRFVGQGGIRLTGVNSVRLRATPEEACNGNA